MYQILGIGRSLSLFGLLCAAMGVPWLLLAPPASIADLWKIASGAVSVSSLAVTVIGQTRIFPALCRLPLIRDWFPPIDGIWKAALESNWPAIQTRGGSENGTIQLAPVGATVTIIARLFYIRMNLVSDDRYSISKTLFVRATRDPEDGAVTLHYLYRNSTRVPDATDSSSHEGAANLVVEGVGNDRWLDGVYWTNRNWRRGQNTAGTITLRRA